MKLGYKEKFAFKVVTGHQEQRNKAETHSFRGKRNTPDNFKHLETGTVQLNVTFQRHPFRKTSLENFRTTKKYEMHGKVEL